MGKFSNATIGGIVGGLVAGIGITGAVCVLTGQTRQFAGYIPPAFLYSAGITAGVITGYNLRLGKDLKKLEQEMLQTVQHSALPLAEQNRIALQETKARAIAAINRQLETLPAGDENVTKLIEQLERLSDG